MAAPQEVTIKFITEDSQLDKSEKKLKDITKAEKDVATQFSSTTKTVNKDAGIMSSTFLKLGGVIAGVFAADRLIQFGQAVIRTTAEFQKFEAVLTNTLGSKSQAQLALKNIVDFATKTPFSVQQLTNSFVKLANQGFKPTTDELRKLGDLAASTGKEFDMLTEAIIDAQTGEFERLKEFGIRASKEGDKVKFTFKGIQTQTDFTNSSIRDYILSLGDLQGVSGSMAAISQTLGGQISNLGDSYDQLLVSIGNANSGMIGAGIQLISNMLTQANAALQLSAALKEAGVNQRDFGLNTERNEAVLKKINEVTAKYNLEYVSEADKAFKELSKLRGESLDELRELGLSEQMFERQSEVELKLIKKAQLDIYTVYREKRDEQIQKEITANEKLAESVKLLNQEIIDSEKQKISEFQLLAEMQMEEMIKKDEKEAERKAKLRDIAISEKEEADEAERAEALAYDQRLFDRLRSEEEYARAKTELDLTILNSASTLAGELAAIAGEQSGLAFVLLGVQKLTKIAEIIVSAKAANALATASAAPLLANPITAAAAAATLTATLAKVNISAGLAIGGIAATAIPEYKANTQQPRRFAKGVIDLHGPGTETSDSIPALLSRRESVMTAEETALFKPTFLAIRNRKVDPNTLNKVSTGALKIDYDRFGSSVGKQIKGIPIHQTYFDEKGVSEFIITNNKKAQVFNKRYGRV